MTNNISNLPLPRYFFFMKSSLSTISLSAMIFAGVGASASAIDFNDKFYGKAQVSAGYYAGLYSGDVKDMIDSTPLDVNALTHSVALSAGFNVFYKAIENLHPFVGLDVQGKYTINGEFVKDVASFQNFLNVNAKLGSSFKVSKGLDIRPYALVGMSVNQYKTKERVDAVENVNVNMLYGTAEQNGNGKYDAALAYVQYNNIYTGSAYYDPNTIKVYTSNDVFKDTMFNTHMYGGGSGELYSNIENLNTGTNIDNFVQALGGKGISYIDETHQLFESNRTEATSNMLLIRDGNSRVLGYAFFDYSNAVGLSGNLAGSTEEGTFEQVLRSYETTEGRWQTWMNEWLAIQVDGDEPSNIPGRADTVNNDAVNNDAVNDDVANINNNETHYNVGLNVGAGVEFVIRFTVGAEYRYTDVKINGIKFKTHNIGVKFGVEFL